MRTFLLVGATAFIVLATAPGVRAEQHENALVKETITIEDLGVENTGLLPTSPFYFLKEWGRGIQGVFAFNPMAKAELQLKITNEKAAELKAVEKKSGEGEGLSRAIKNYENAQVRLRFRLEQVGEFSQNPNVEALLEKIAERAMLHEKLFSEITERKESVKDVAGEARERIRLTLKSVAERDDSDAFAERIENALERTRKVRLEHVRDAEILDNLQEVMPEKVKERMEQVRERALERAKHEMEKIEEEADASEDGREGIERMLSRIPGDKARRSVILEELRVRVKNHALGEKIREASKNLVENEPEEKSADDRKTENIVCTTQYDPVCGVNGVTYSNACVARVAGVGVARKEACEKNERGEENGNEEADERPEAKEEKTESVQDGAVRMFERVRTLLPR